MRSAAQIKLDVEVGAAIGQINRFTNKLKTVNQSMRGTKSGAEGVGGSIGGWSGGIAKAAGALLKYKAIMIGIQTAQEAVQKSMEDIARRAEQSRERQLSFSNEMRNLVHMFGGGDGSISLDSIRDMVKGAKVTDHAQLLRTVSATISTKDKDTTISEAVTTAITVAENTGRLRGTPDQQRDFATGVMKLYDASDAAEAAEKMGRSKEEMDKAQMAFVDAYVQVSPGRDLSASMTAGIPGVANLMRQGLSQSAAGAAIATLATQAGDMEQRKSATAALNTLSQIKKQFIKQGATGELRDDADLQWALLTGTATDEQAAKYADITGKTRTKLLGQVYSSNEQLNEIAAKRGMTWKEVVDRGLQDSFEEQIPIGGELHGRAQMMSAVTRLLQGGEDKGITNAYKEGLKALIDPIKNTAESVRRFDEMMATERKYGRTDVAAQEAEELQASGRLRDTTGRVAQQKKDLEAMKDQWGAQDYGKGGPLEWFAQVNRGVQSYIRGLAIDPVTYGNEDAQAIYSAMELIMQAPKEKRGEVADKLRSMGVSESAIRTALREGRKQDMGVIGLATGGDGTWVGSGLSVASRAINPGVGAWQGLTRDMYNVMNDMVAEQRATNEEARRQTNIMEAQGSRPVDVRLDRDGIPNDRLQQNENNGG